MAPLLAHLRGLGVTPIAASEPVNAVERLLTDYARFLVRERGFAGATVQRYVGFARRFVAQRAGTDGEVDLAAMSPEEVTQFVLRECSERVPGSAKCGLTRLRSLLRFLHVEGRAPELAWAVPSGPSWRLASLPKGIDRRQVTALLASCDRRTAVGRRDFAILTMLVRLGLRCGEVANLELADLDWRAGEILVRGKGSREERLPLPVDVGEAVAGWLRRGRPRCGCTKVFTRVLAPHRGLTSSAVSSVVVSAAVRAGLPPIGAHRLRPEVGQVLRHRSALSTSLYAKVDLAALSEIARHVVSFVKNQGLGFAIPYLHAGGDQRFRRHRLCLSGLGTLGHPFWRRVTSNAPTHKAPANARIRDPARVRRRRKPARSTPRRQEGCPRRIHS